MQDAPKLFISYAHKDKNWLDQLLVHLRPLKQQKKVALWTDREIPIGAEWHAEIESALKDADVAVLLVTPAFIDSGFIHDIELPELLKKHVVWIAMESSLYTHTPLAKLQCVNNPSKPLGDSRGNARNRALVDICEKILEVATRVPIRADDTPSMPSSASSNSVPVATASGERVGTPHISFEPRTNSKDAAEIIWIPAGTFQMGDVEQKDNPQRIVTLDGYWIYKTPVTVTQYRQFCSETNREMPDAPDWGWIEKHPIVNVNWIDATAYCDWAGMHLPTDAQWEKAARGTDGRMYPWGDEWDDSKCANSAGSYNPKSTSPVGSYREGASPYGVLDMSGNVCEWCEDWYASDYFATENPIGPTGPDAGKGRVLRGGSWAEYKTSHFICALRNDSPPATKDKRVGFRCCASAGRERYCWRIHAPSRRRAGRIKSRLTPRPGHKRRVSEAFGQPSCGRICREVGASTWTLGGEAAP